LKEAQADVAEAEQKILQAQAQRDAQHEEDQYALIKARNDVRVAELDVRKNPLLPAITARQNVLAFDSAQEHLRQVQQNLANRATTGDAGIAKETAGKLKAVSQAKTARENIEAMTLRAKRAGYVSVKQNVNTNFGFIGMILPDLQVGDSVRPGMAIVEIPDLEHWEVSASVAEIDRGHIKPGDAVTMSVVALPDRTFRGHVSNLGGTTGNFWERHFECKVALDEQSEAMRPGMSAELTIATDSMRNALSIPAQALFESQGATFVYLASGSSFARKDVKLIRRNETRAVISGLSAGQTVALANPLDRKEKKALASDPLKAGPR
jgi:HlyD family secretion protein